DSHFSYALGNGLSNHTVMRHWAGADDRSGEQRRSPLRSGWCRVPLGAVRFDRYAVAVDVPRESFCELAGVEPELREAVFVGPELVLRMGIHVRSDRVARAGVELLAARGVQIVDSPEGIVDEVGVLHVDDRVLWVCGPERVDALDRFLEHGGPVFGGVGRVIG